MWRVYASVIWAIISNNDLFRRRVIWIVAGTLLIQHLEINTSEILIEIKTFSLKKMHFTLSSAKWRTFWLQCVKGRQTTPLVSCSFIWLSTSFSQHCAQYLLWYHWWPTHERPPLVFWYLYSQGFLIIYYSSREWRQPTSCRELNVGVEYHQERQNLYKGQFKT